MGLARRCWLEYTALRLTPGLSCPGVDHPHPRINQETTKLELGSRKVAKWQFSEQREAHISALPNQEPKTPWAELTWGPAHQWDELSHPSPPAQDLGWGCRYPKPRAPRVGRGWMSGLVPQAELLYKGRNTCRLPTETVNNVCARIPAPEPVGPGSHARVKLGLRGRGLAGGHGGLGTGSPWGGTWRFRED